MWITPYLSLLPGPLRPGMVLLVNVPSMDLIQLFNYLTPCRQMRDVKLNY